MGPSPRIRGELEPADSCVHGIGTIPANTGRILPSWLHLTFLTDHPREYGENAIDLNNAAIRVGPSPRIRGESDSPIYATIPRGTIPANTGRIGWLGAVARNAWDHPREYGENVGLNPITELVRGPSPRIRGECVEFAD